MRARSTFPTYLVLACLIVWVRCATTSSDWKKAQSLDSVYAYEKFVSKHPDSEMSEHAKKRIAELKDEQARSIAQLEAYQPGVTTENEFLADGWSPQDANRGQMGVTAIWAEEGVSEYSIGFAGQPVDSRAAGLSEAMFEIAVMDIRGEMRGLYNNVSIRYENPSPCTQVCLLTFEEGVLKSVQWINR